MIDVNDPHADDKIRAALKEADRNGTLQDVALRVGIAGGVAALREIMESNGPLHIMDRGMIGLHL